MSYVGKVIDTAGNTHLVGSTLYGTCPTAAGTAAKVVTCANFDKLEIGVTIHVKFDNANTASSPTLNVNNLGPKKIAIAVADGTAQQPLGYGWNMGAVVSFTYDGTYWLMNDNYNVVTSTTDTKNTTGAVNNTSKMFLIGALSQGANPVTYSNSGVYATDGALHANSFNGVSMAALSGIGVSIGTPTYSVQLREGDSFVLDDACAKAVDTSIASGSSSTNLPTSQAVADYVDSAVAVASSGALTYKGTAANLAAITGTSYKKGWYWIASAAFGIGSHNVEAGDMIIAKQDKTSTATNDLDLIQTNIEALTSSEIDALWAAA